MNRLCALIFCAAAVSAGGALADPTSPAIVPNPAVTPGVARPLATDQVCSTKWGHDQRAVTAAMKAQVFEAYDIRIPRDGGRYSFPKLPGGGSAYEVDHLISRELGGADDVKNLWPEPYMGAWNAHDKDRVENRLHVEVCAGHLTLDRAQQEIRTDWRIPYRQYFGNPGDAR